MRIFIMTLGSRGDVQPYVALGKGLLAAGHEVTLCTAARYAAFVRASGLAFGPLGDDVLALMDSDTGRELMEDVDNIWAAISAFRRLSARVAPAQRILFDDGFRVAQALQPELIVFHPKAYAAAYFAQALRVPAVLMSLLPAQYVPTAQQPSFGFPALPLGPLYNKLTAKVLVWSLMAYVGKYIDAFRAQQGLAGKRRDMLHAPFGKRIPVMHAYSPALAPVPTDWPDDVTVTGALFVDEASRTFQPPDALTRFLSSGSPPIYVGFGSMVGRNSERLTQTVLSALARTKTRAVVATGWGGLSSTTLPEEVFAVDEAPHGWLFPRVAAVVHHGGAGTTAAGLRAARPTVVCPFFGDQPYWGGRVQTLGAGACTRPQKAVTADELARAIVRVTTDASIRRRAAVLSEALRNEDGVAAAVTFLERVSKRPTST